MITFTYDEHGFQTTMTNIVGKAKRPAGVLAVAGRAGANELHRHFLQKDRTDANKIAPDRRQHLWQQIAHAVQSPVVDEAGNRVYISINHPVIAQKVFGGRIEAKRVQNLSIPEAPEAYGRAPSVFERETGLKLIFIRSGDHAVLATRIDKDSPFLQVEYLLTPYVDQQADPTALPDPATMQTAIIGQSQKALDRQLQEGNK